MKEKGLAYYLKYPERIGEVSDEEIDGLISRYPYSQSLRWLKARKDLDGHSPGKINSIRKAASYADDLIFLRFQLLRDQSALEELSDNLQKAEAQPAIDKKEESSTPAVEEKSEPEHKAPVKETTPGKKIKKASKKKVKSAKKQENIQASSTPTVEEKQQTVEKVIREFEEELSDFSQWLIAQGSGSPVSNKKSEGKKEEKKGKKKKTEPKSKKKKKKGKKEKKNKLQKLIDHSIVEQDELVTETYAQLVADQGHTAKAIELYEKLQLKMPEKSSYFARKIEELKNS